MILRAMTAGGVLLAGLAASGGASAQYYGNDAYCRQYADQSTASLRAQAGGQTVGSTLLGAGLGAALGAAAGGGSGAAIGAASGAAVGAVGGAATTSDYVQQQYNAYYYQCMQGQTAAPAYAPAPVYAPAPGYAPAPVYAPGYYR